jgi:hypothetical protein
MWWELGVSCGLVVVGHARTLYRLHRVNDAVEYEGYMDSYNGPLVDRTDPEDITAWHEAARKDARRAKKKTNKRRREIAAEVDASIEATKRERMTSAMERQNRDYLRALSPTLMEAELNEAEIRRTYAKDDWRRQVILPMDPGPTFRAATGFTKEQIMGMSTDELAAYGLIPPDYLKYNPYVDSTGQTKYNPVGRPPMCEKPPKPNPTVTEQINVWAKEVEKYLDTMATMALKHTCTTCGRTSSNPNDVKHGYCGACHHFCKERGCSK